MNLGTLIPNRKGQIHCFKCRKEVKVGENFYYMKNSSKKKYCKSCGDKLYQ